MSTFKVTAEQLTIHPHPNADSLELAQVGLYKAVVPKGRYSTGDWAVYIPEQAVLPPNLIEELGLANYLAGADHNRVKAVRLRGELSQGIVCRPSSVTVSSLWAAAEAGIDFAELLGIEKWVPEIPASMNGVVKPAPDLIPWIDIENVKRYPNVFGPNELVTASEKLHGTACLFTMLADGTYFVSSKGHGDRHLCIEESETNLYWRAIRHYNVPQVAKAIIERYELDRIAIYGEVYGAGVQDLTYGVRGNVGKPGYAVFDVRVDDSQGLQWMNQSVMRYIIGDRLPLVPQLYVGAYDVDELMALASGTETVSGTEAHVREGLVVRPMIERYSPELGGRAILKFISDDYLMRKGGTEYV